MLLPHDPLLTTFHQYMDDTHSKPSLLERLSALLMREPEDREQLIKLLHSSFERNLLDADALAMIEGVLQVSEMQARDIMVPRAQMDVIDISESPDQFIPTVIETAHSRFPVIGSSKDDVIGILLAKDLLRYYAGEEEFNVRDMLRPAVFIPESKPLNVLLKEFRKNRNHIAIVVDEYGGVAGLVTIEDVLEQIVGDIEDEYDFDDVEDNIVQEKSGLYRVKALTEIGDFNAAFGTHYSDEEFDTIGGLILKRFGRVPKRGEQITIDNLTFKILRSDSRRLHLLQVAKKGGK
ncbi:MAG: HlyC/CorC family transporter [Burkholderiales bacterium]